MRAPLSSFSVETPRTLPEALAAMAASPERLTPLAGGTDLYVYLNAAAIRPGRWLDLWRLDELRGIEEDAGHVVLGALTTYSELRRSPVVRALLPLLAEAASTVGSVAIQNRGTLGGNIANGSPAGDSLPALLAYDAEVGVISSRGQRWVPFDAFYTGYRATVLEKDELIARVRFAKPVLSQSGAGRFVKIGTRSAQAISKVVGAFTLALDSAGAVTRCRCALGSVAPTPVRVTAVESHLHGRKLDGAAIDASVKLLGGSISPIDDIRSTAAYRRFVACRAWERFLADTAGGLS